jgi:hypothetical protein
MTVIMYCRPAQSVRSRSKKAVERATNLGSLELPEGDIDGDTTLTLGLQLVEHPCVLEGALAKLGGFL